MLRTLSIQNYALIEALDIRFDEGFSVITGETGAGKSIILGALGLLLGGRADSRSIRAGANRCTIEGVFDVADSGLKSFFDRQEWEYDDECIIRRELYASGKSRAFVNDTPVGLNELKELGDLLIDVHSQHRNLLLGKEDFQMEVLDILADNAAPLQAYRTAYHAWKQAEQDLQALRDEAKRSRSDEDYLRYQLEQLDEARLATGEQEELEQEADTLTYAETIKAALYRTIQSLDGEEHPILSALKSDVQTMTALHSVFAPAAELAARMESSYIELKDIAAELSDRLERIEANPTRLEEVNDRLSTLYALQQKHHVRTVDELIALTTEYRTRLKAITSADEHITEAEQHCQACRKIVADQAGLLTERRTAAVRLTERQLVERLIPLGMPNIRFQVEIQPRTDPTPQGMDAVTFLFSANKNTPLQPLSVIASGGEVARVMLAVKALIAGAVKLPTIIFDEIDTGVSGEIAERMADMMKEMSGDGTRQVISITHLPQIAARGRAHFLVYKEDNDQETNSHIRRLSDDERVTEIARMLSGAKLTEAALANAKVLLHGL
jgi:DNA repair protein RecN (Recombination protein N)